ncbi:MAG: hypothetical protein ABFD18_06340 [Syntrophomonas sp.]
MDVNVTDHACRRYCERIIHIPPDDITEYLKENRPVVIEEITRLYDKSTLIYQGKLNEANKPASFLVVDNIMLVASYERKALKTLYPVNLPFTPTLKIKLARVMVREIVRTQKELDKARAIADRKLKTQRDKQDQLDKQAAKLREKLNQVEAEKKKVRRRIWEINSRPEELQKQIHDLVVQLNVNPNCEQKGRKVKKSG